MKSIKALIYKIGFRPQLGNVFHSPSLSLIYCYRDYNVGEAMATAIKKVRQLNTAKPHVTNGKCWCKRTVPVTFDGQKVGNATIDHTGSLSVAINSEYLAAKFAAADMKSLSIDTNIEEPVEVSNTRKF